MIKHGNGYKLDRGGIYPEVLCQVKDLLTGEVHRIFSKHGNAFCTEEEAVEYLEEHKDIIHRLIIVRLDCLVYKR